MCDVNSRDSLLAGGLWFFLSRKKNGKRGVRLLSPERFLARVQDGAGDRELRVIRGFSAIKRPTNRLQAGLLEGFSRGFEISQRIFNSSLQFGIITNRLTNLGHITHVPLTKPVVSFM